MVNTINNNDTSIYCLHRTVLHVAISLSLIHICHSTPTDIQPSTGAIPRTDLCPTSSYIIKKNSQTWASKPLEPSNKPTQHSGIIHIRRGPKEKAKNIVNPKEISSLFFK